VRQHRIYSRRTTARKVREEAAEIAFLRPHPDHPNNGEESSYRNSSNELSYIGNYSKGLPHNNIGEVTPSAYRAMVRVLTSGEPDEFERIPLGTIGGFKLINPQAGLAFDLEGPDCHALFIPPAPRIDGLEAAGEMVELYWMALLRDINFADFSTNNLVTDAANELSGLVDFKGPQINGNVTPETIFRGNTPGNLAGPYISQFLLKGNKDSALNYDEKRGFIKFGTLRIDQRQKTVMAGTDFLKDENSWKDAQNGEDFNCQNIGFDSTPRFIRNMRDLANYVHFDALYEAYFNACLYLLNLNSPCENLNLPPHAPFDIGNPYIDSQSQIGFGTFGGPHILSLVTEVATRALKAVWFQKWFVHRRLRPEEFGGRIHYHKTGLANYPIRDQVLNSQALQRVFNSNNSYFLPQAFPEGAPTHPSYGAGHATVAGACVTILKAWFDESFPIENPVISNANGTALVNYTGPDKDSLTVGGELNKLAANIAIGRNMAGVHYRSDYTESIKLGEIVAIGILEEQKLTYNENHSFTFTRFDGTSITI
jgi:hypothetical protein